MTAPSRAQVVASAVIAAVAVGITLGLYFGHALRPIEQSAVDARFDVRGSDGPPSDVVAVAIDDATFAKLGVRWPFPRCLHANVLDQIAKGSPRAIAVDIQFTEPSEARAADGVPCDQKLA